VLNDGAYGAEIHKLRQDGLDDSGAIFGRTDFASISKGFGLRGTNVIDLGQLGALMRDNDAQGTAEIWNFPISDQVTSPSMRRQVKKGHGVM
jgi:acetolactate synthase I/II/III large subunit